MSLKNSENTFFLPYQLRWINDTAQLKIIEKSRQIGISWATAYALVRRHSHPHTRFDAWISSRDEFQSKLLLEDCKNFSRLLDIATREVGHHFIDPSSRPSTHCLTFSNGRSLHSLSSSVDSQAGKRGTRVLDEFALHPNPSQLYTLSFPGITWGGNLEIISTHRGSNNFFNQLIQEIVENGNPKKFSHHRVTLQDALDQGFLKKIKTKLNKEDPRQIMDEATYFDSIRASCPDEDSFLQEYMCQPANDNEYFLPTDLITTCEYPIDHAWELNLQKSPPDFVSKENFLVLGIDIGRTHDLTVFWLIEVTPNQEYYTRHITALKNTPFLQQEEVLNHYLSHPQLTRVCIDQTGLGLQFTERAIHHYPHIHIEGIHFTSQSKEGLAYPVRLAFEKQSIKIPSSDLIRSDLRSIKRYTTFAGNTRYGADRSKKGHADFFWALALALHAAGSWPPPQPFFYQSLNRPHFRYPLRKSLVYCC